MKGTVHAGSTCCCTGQHRWASEVAARRCCDSLKSHNWNKHTGWTFFMLPSIPTMKTLQITRTKFNILGIESVGFEQEHAGNALAPSCGVACARSPAAALEDGRKGEWVVEAFCALMTSCVKVVLYVSPAFFNLTSELQAFSASTKGLNALNLSYTSTI